MSHILAAQDKTNAVERLAKRVLPIFLAAKKQNVFVNVDVEQWETHEITYALFEKILAHPELSDWPHVGIVIQAYLKNAINDLERLSCLARKRGAPITVRLVKGAYWDYEVVHANFYGHECPVYLKKELTDLNYESLSRKLLGSTDCLVPAFGSHNLRSLCHALACAEEMAVPKNSFEIQMLYGMAEPERRALVSMGNLVRVYAPLGKMLPGMAYLVRRLLENTANSGFLRMSYHNNVDVNKLLKAPDESQLLEDNFPQQYKRETFTNCSLLDFTNDCHRKLLADSIEKTLATIPFEIPVVIDGKPCNTGDSLETLCPGDGKSKIAQISLANVDMAKQALEVCYSNYPKWRDQPLKTRSDLLLKLADRLEKDRFELAALQIVEVAKNWSEADADVAEAIDFCRYYALRAQEEIAPGKQGSVLGQESLLVHEGRGPTVIIAPWNFPLAILCGMSAASLVCGNPIVMKPAEQSSATAYALYQRMIDVGYPPGVVQFLPALGEKVGPALVSHPLTAQIAFTGSKEVGQEIVANSAKVVPGQIQMRRVICEMGGKNAIIVDNDADLDEAVSGVLSSAFGYAGQKCSACSRVLILENIYDQFVGRLVEATKSLIIAPSHLPSCELGPVIDSVAHQRLLTEMAEAKENARLIYQGDAPKTGYFIPPTIFEVDDPHHRLMQAEFFGPIVSIMKVADFDSALKIATSTEFALTGAVFSRSPVNLAKSREKFRVGNLYLNLSSTGAFVNRHPFGGFGMSGLGTKAGGPGYLSNFVEMRTICENTMRRGFTPELDA